MAGGGFFFAHRRAIGVASVLCLGGFRPGWSQGLALSAGSAQLRLESGNGGYGVVLSFAGDGAAAFRQDAPLALQLETASGTSLLQGRYAEAIASGKDTLTASGSIRSANGTVFSFRDIYSAPGDSGVFFFSRQVGVSSPAADDRGFATRFSLPLDARASFTDCEFLIPGILYRNNESMTANALAGDFQADDIFIREDRLPLPLILMRRKATGVTLTLLHRGIDGRTVAGDNANRTVTDARLQYASLGMHDRTRPSPGMWFPGSEGGRTYYGGGWAYRRHPVNTAVSHRYSAAIRLTRTPDFAAAVTADWDYAFGLAPPAIRRADLARVKTAGIDLLSRSWKRFNDGSAGFPFSISLIDGHYGDYAMQMGFIGQNLPGANELIRAGLKQGKADLVSQGEKMADFWVAESPGNRGLPKTWYDANIGFRSYQTFLRIATDGVLGALRAWGAMKAAGKPRPSWLAYARDFGDWLVAHQNADGSFYRQYDYNTGAALTASKTNTVHPIPFLTELFRATGDARYRDGALKAGDFALKDVHRAYRYVGGTPDNPDVRDKEAGVLALDAFLALHDLTGEAEWLAAARQAATYVETWAYAWPVPVVAGDDSADFPAGRDQTGLSLIAVGHSGADAFMAYGPFAFFRLYVKTGETHFLDYSRFLLHNTKQNMDWDPAHPLGYPIPGLQTEVSTVCSPRGHSKRIWLPWLTVGALVPMSQLEDVYGNVDVDVLASKSIGELRAKDDGYAATRGYGSETNPVLRIGPHAVRPRNASRWTDILGRIHPASTVPEKPERR
jgi:hypothetical protein